MKKARIWHITIILCFITIHLMGREAYSARCEALFESIGRTIVLPAELLNPDVDQFVSVHPITKEEKHHIIVRGDYPRTDFYYEAELVREQKTNTNEIFLDLKLVDLKGNIRVEESGEAIFSKIMSIFGLNKILISSRSNYVDRILYNNRKTKLGAIWVHNSVNFATFKRQVEAGIPINEAAANTWTGRQASKYGLRKITVQSYDFYHQDLDSRVVFVDFSN